MTLITHPCTMREQNLVMLNMEDINGDGVINSADITAIGYPQYPETYGINGGVYYKNFDLMFYYKATNVSIALSDEFIIPYLNKVRNEIYMNERWTPKQPKLQLIPE